MNEQEMMGILERTGAVKKGHFKLSSGLHADTYFQCALALKNAKTAREVGEAIAALYDRAEFETVISPAIGGLVLGYAVASALDKDFIWAERQEGEMRFRRGFYVAPKEKVLVVEDVITTGGSVNEVISLVRAAGGEVIGVAVMLNRGGLAEIAGVPVKAMATAVTKAYRPEECPLCEAKKPIESPGSRRC